MNCCDCPCNCCSNKEKKILCEYCIKYCYLQYNKSRNNFDITVLTNSKTNDKLNLSEV